MGKLEEHLNAGSTDPDDMAIVLCAAIFRAGIEPRVLFRVKNDHAIAIEVHAPFGNLVAILPMQPIALGDVADGTLALAIVAAGKLKERTDGKA
jgi:hypothetical protein